MISALPVGTPTGLRDRAILVLGFALMGRHSEITEMDIGDLAVTDDGLEVLLPVSKTDHDAHGETVAIHYGSHPDTCPVRVVRAWLANLADAGITSCALFRSIGRQGGIRDCPQSVNLIVKGAAAAAGLEHAEAYAAHGLRAEGATSAAKAGAPMSAITRHGRWADGSRSWPATSARPTSGPTTPCAASPVNVQKRGPSRDRYRASEGSSPLLYRPLISLLFTPVRSDRSLLIL